MRKVIVTTTINPPTDAIRRFAAMKDWTMVIMGDRKTPADYHVDNAVYVTPDEQHSYDPALSDAIGWNSIQRRNFGLLWAHDMKADVVAVIDDDNIPYDNWGSDLKVGRELETNYFETSLPAFDPVGATNHAKLWHRGYPLQLLPKREYSRKTKKRIVPDVQADFWDGDPDIDAICRMEHAPECKFDPACFPIASNAIGPFNSQNTFLTARCLRDYFLFPHVGRMDDIWGAYYLQAKGFSVAWTAASVYQQRNVHDLVKDMRQEYLGYENNLRIVEAIRSDPESLRAFLPERSAAAFDLYRKHFAAE